MAYGDAATSCDSRLLVIVPGLALFQFLMNRGLDISELNMFSKSATRIRKDNLINAHRSYNCGSTTSAALPFLCYRHLYLAYSGIHRRIWSTLLLGGRGRRDLVDGRGGMRKENERKRPGCTATLSATAQRKLRTVTDLVGRERRQGE